MTKYFLFLIMSLVSMVNLAAKPIIALEGGNEKLFTVSMDGFKDEVNLAIFNENREEIFNSKYSTSLSKSKTFNVNALPNGQYILVLSDELKEKVTPFEVFYNEVNFQTHLSSITYTPGIQQIGERVHINTLLEDSAELVVSVLDENDQEVYSDKFQAKDSFGKILNFRELPNGFYIVRLSIEGKWFTKTIVLK